MQLNAVHLDPNISDDILYRIEQLNSIGIALSCERNTDRLMEMILNGIKTITHADGGTLYTVSDNQQLHFEILRTDSLNIAMGGTHGTDIPFDPIPLFDLIGNKNDHTVVAYAALNAITVNIKDAYCEKGFDFSGTRSFDKKMNYRSKTFLTVPIKNSENAVIAILQLINKIDPYSHKVVEFTREDERLAESLASQAAVALTNKRLLDEQKELFESFIRLIATAIDEKSPYTGGHCKRVPILTLLLAQAACKKSSGPLADFAMQKSDFYELEIAAWLHDCGKITTPEYIVDKATKLETIYDRIELIETRAEILKRDEEIAYLKQSIEALKHDRHEKSQRRDELNSRIEDIKQNVAFINKSNIGGEFMDENDCNRIKQMSKITWKRNDQNMPFITEDEVYNLCIAKGTLTNEERKVINNHIVASIKMLESLPFPNHLKNVPEFAAGHHERMDGKGYPYGLSGSQMSVQARIMAIADIFEALTAKDRPYKKAKKLSEALSILGKMKQDCHIDPDLFDIFIENKVYLQYAQSYLESDQKDIEEPYEIPGYPFV